jgi:CRP-like cAMP-binding protein
MASKAAHIVGFGAEDEDESELKAYVADLREHADDICEQLQDEIAKERQVLRSTSLLHFLQDEVTKQHTRLGALEETPVKASTPLSVAPRFAEPVVLRDAKRFAALVQVAEAEKESSDSYWKEWAGSIERTSKAQYTKAQQEASKALERAQQAEERAAAAELHAAALGAASLPQGGSTVAQRELKLDDLLQLGQRLGVRIILGTQNSKESELDNLVAEVQETLAPPCVQGKVSCAPLSHVQQTLEHNFVDLLKSVRKEMNEMLTKLAQQHDLEMSRISGLRAETHIAVQASSKDGSQVSVDKETTVPELPELCELRTAAIAGLPGQIFDSNARESPESKVSRGRVSPRFVPDRSLAKQLWEPELCAVWSNAFDAPELQRNEDSIIAMDDADCCESCRCCNGLVMREASSPRFVWDVLSTLLIAYDVVITPLHVLGLPNNIGLNGMMWVKPVFWLSDIVWSFMSGYVHDGIDEVRLKKIAWRYATSFLPLDALLFVLDVCTLLMLSHGTFDLVDYNGRRLHGTHIDDSVQDERVLFALRCLLALRLWKVHSKMEQRLNWRIHSQSLQIKLGIVEIVMFILICCHLAACGFYAIGVIEDDQDNSWVEKNLVGKTVGVKYLTSLQWSLAQFTVGTTEVYAGSFAECVFSSGVSLVAAFLLMQLLWRGIGAVLHWTSTAQGKRKQQLTLLMEYLVQCHAPPSLRSRVWATAAQRAAKVDASCQRLHEHEVAILACLPPLLQSELRLAVYSPTLQTHPLFRELVRGLGDTVQSRCNTGAIRALHASLTQRALYADEALFSAGQLAESMYFVAQGECAYRSMGDGKAIIVSDQSVGPWFSEPSLWINWEHRGEMEAVIHTELFVLNAKRFQDLMAHESSGARLCREYARAFATFARQCQMRMTDVIDEHSLENMVFSILQGFSAVAPGSSEKSVTAPTSSESPEGADLHAIRASDSHVGTEADTEASLAAAQANPSSDLLPPSLRMHGSKGSKADASVVPDKPLQPFYRGSFCHPVFGTDEIPIEVSLLTATQGRWTAEEQTEEITVLREGKNILLAESTGQTQLDGHEEAKGALVGVVIQAGERGGWFQLQPCSQV